jgi:hypothetical protein
MSTGMWVFRAGIRWGRKGERYEKDTNSYPPAGRSVMDASTSTIERAVQGIALGEESYSGWGAQLDNVTITNNLIEGCGTGIMVFSSDVGGTTSNVTIDNNWVPSGIGFAISVDNGRCQNVSITNNKIWWTNIWVRCSGVQLSGNVLSTVTPTPGVPPNTSVPPTATLPPTVIVPSATPIVPTDHPPTVTFTPTVIPTQTPQITDECIEIFRDSEFAFYACPLRE